MIFDANKQWELAKGNDSARFTRAIDDVMLESVLEDKPTQRECVVVGDVDGDPDAVKIKIPSHAWPDEVFEVMRASLSE